MPEWVNETVRKRIYKLFTINSFLLTGSELLVRLRSGIREFVLYIYFLNFYLLY